MNTARCATFAIAFLQTAPLFAGPAEEKAALEKMLPRFQQAWNSAKPENFIALLHPDSRMKKAYESKKEAKDLFDREFAKGMKTAGKVESFEIRKYIERKGRHVVRVKYSEMGEVPGTFSMKQNEEKDWLILDFNIDGQGEPELKE